MNTDKKWEIVELDTVATGYKIKSLMDERNVSIEERVLPLDEALDFISELLSEIKV